MADRTFKYVDKDRILPWLEKMASYAESTGDDMVGMLEAAALYAKASAYREVAEHIKEGLSDWQPSE
jgi:hypothetical protein